jgi:hypothetical protein
VLYGNSLDYVLVFDKPDVAIVRQRVLICHGDPVYINPWG